MEDIARYHYDLRFERDFLKRKANAFQDFFSELMQKVYPDDFIATRPWGKIGDRKNDGYLKSERKLFQVYAPDKLIALKAVAKIDKDFKGALPYWKKYFDKWVFVHNGKDLNVEIAAKLLELGGNTQQSISVSGAMRRYARSSGNLATKTLPLGSARRHHWTRCCRSAMRILGSFS